jgi:error-prone DNA polymerase
LFLTLDDGFGCSDLTFFEDSQQGYAHIIKGNNLIIAKGVIRRTGARGISIRASAAWALEDLYQEWVSEQKAIRESLQPLVGVRLKMEDF